MPELTTEEYRAIALIYEVRLPELVGACSGLSHERRLHHARRAVEALLDMKIEAAAKKAAKEINERE